MTETNLVQSIRLALSNGPCRVWRNNQGRLRDATGRWVQFGVGHPGGSDLIGYKTIRVTQELVGRDLAVFVAMECKTGRLRPTDEQQNFLNRVRDAGGIADVVHSVDEAEVLIRSL